MASGRYAIRPMRRADLDLAVEWAAAEGWNPGLHDADVFHATDPQGFLIGELDGAPVASISAVAYGEAFGFIGFYIVKPGHRGGGLGLQIWRAAMARLGSRNIGLDGVLAQQDNYRKSGFRLAYRNVRHEGTARAGSAAGLVDARGVPFETIERYDRRLFPAPREIFLRKWLALPGSHGLALVRDGALAGYGVVHPCRKGFKIGPLFANDDTTAEALIAGLSAKVAVGAPIYLDVPEVNGAAMALARRHGMTPMFETARMYTGPDPAVDLARVWGVTTFELG
jgi:ribosomal protein S18 acetylase RimI-like enzyme